MKDKLLPVKVSWQDFSLVTDIHEGSIGNRNKFLFFNLQNLLYQIRDFMPTLQ